MKEETEREKETGDEQKGAKKMESSI